jgi:hypothetical protein
MKGAASKSENKKVGSDGVRTDGTKLHKGIKVLD